MCDTSVMNDPGKMGPVVQKVGGRQLKQNSFCNPAPMITKYAYVTTYWAPRMRIFF